ncbi:hypothetical protein BJ508DRAFT_379656 [Ascobolus immersus RN42]|uniref:Secreted protein n=1 Tax=Ascobolus immersus RN42 TaxID=1160509 RepID=A0A3N4HSQ5_ASCIM|nr:hypothetical protein BJ508DRAFT_379656 [Ascobolus immersus RN42]
MVEFNAASILALVCTVQVTNAIPLSTPEPSSISKVNWKTVTFGEAYPGALVDGKPIGPDTVLYRIIPDDVAATVSAKGDANELEKRDTLSCYKRGNQVLKSQVQNAKNIFCNHAQAANPSNGNTFAESWDWYPLSNGNWVRFTDQNSNLRSVWFWIKVNNGFVFNWNNCFDAFWSVINQCPTNNAQSFGGSLKGAKNGQVEVSFDVVD